MADITAALAAHRTGKIGVNANYTPGKDPGKVTE